MEVGFGVQYFRMVTNEWRCHCKFSRGDLVSRRAIAVVIIEIFLPFTILIWGIEVVDVYGLLAETTSSQSSSVCHLAGPVFDNLSCTCNKNCKMSLACCENVATLVNFCLLTFTCMCGSLRGRVVKAVYATFHKSSYSHLLFSVNIDVAQTHQHH